jgi:hypothetical protein
MLAFTNANTKLPPPVNKDVVALSTMLSNITYVNALKIQENLTLTYH